MAANHHHRRAPLANVPNAVNSPFRGGLPAPSASVKRTRAQSGEKEIVLGQPPFKKQAVESLDDSSNNEENVDPRKRRSATVVGQDKLEEPFGGARRNNNARPTELQQRLAAARDRKVPTNLQQQSQQQQQRPDRAMKATTDNLESIRQWQRHYRKQFPQFAFYFDLVPEDARTKTAAQFRSLGAKECRFFSKDVTHVITTRPIPPELSSGAAAADAESKNGNEAQQPKTIRPSALTQDQRRTTDLLDANLQRRSQHNFATGHQDVDSRRLQGQNVDMLVRAREMGIKIWALEKLQRVLRTMLETDTGEAVAAVEPRDSGVATTRGAAAALKTAATAAATNDVDLERLLRHEKVNGPADRDMTVASQDTVPFKGCYIYIHDMDERTKPVMVRDYPKPPVKEQGKWPQFRLTPAGRCPFIEDPVHTSRLQQGREAADAAATKAQQELASQRKTRAAAAGAGPLRPAGAVEGGESNLRRSPRKAVQQQATRNDVSKPLDPPKLIPAKRQSSLETVPQQHLFGSAQQHLRGLPRMIGGEPVASGMQQSNITSAIRSQVISSAAISSTAPGFPTMRGGDSREVSALKRKVLERGGGANVPTTMAATTTSNHSIPSSYMNEMRAALNEPQDPPPRAAKRRAQETLGVLHEGDENDDGAVAPGQADRGGARAAKKMRKAPVQQQKEPKAGYCENCRDKFEDFDEHCNSRKHRKFALEPENWKELDSLLSLLKRPHKIV